MKNSSLSVITLTKNRAALLAKHLASLVGQTRPGDEIIIIDNGSTDETSRVIASFRTVLSLRVWKSLRSGYPKLYNLGVQKARNSIIVFFDDDCVAAAGFLRGHRAAHRDGKPKVVQGQTFSLPKGNIYADIMGDHYQNWLTIHKVHGNFLKTFDNKNASLPKSLLKKYGMFSEKQSHGAEDIELGLRLHAHGVPIHFAPRIIAYHHERSTLAGFIRQHLRFAVADSVLAKDVPREETLAMFVRQKVLLHIQTALHREWWYIKTGDVGKALYLPVLYVTLFIMRVWGYATAR